KLRKEPGAIDRAGPAISALVRLIRPELSTEDRGIVGDILARGLADHVQDIELARWILIPPDDQNLLEALVVRVAVECGTITHAVELEGLQSLDHLGRIEGAGTFHSVSVENCLDVA